MLYPSYQLESKKAMQGRLYVP
uniref:Uncharacterized protein n=1 Tax=Physcomitrium patens TaxID=3218 RepID=A0A2K1LB87_PHYPA|nr:hypothetical protein PHYPA_001718 [Physcomitrium patens]PNR63294.1 hypothetical protein PHYPA_001719 [Physcomitrium patens]